MNRPTTRLLAALVLGVAAPAHAEYVNYEVHPAHALDLNPDRSVLAIAHTDADRAVLVDVDLGIPLAHGSVPVGMRPVAVRFADANTLWVVNHLSDSISIVDIVSKRVSATLATADEPYDVVFAGSPRRAFVSCSQANRIQVFETTAPYARVADLPIAGEDPRSLAVSADGSKVYAAIFESGNATTVLAGDTVSPPNAFPPNVLRLADTPYGGQTPAPNAGSGFSPASNPANPAPPKAALIVRRQPDRRWTDSVGSDWTRWVSGASAGLSAGRVSGWDMLDNDLAIVDANSLSVSYAGGALSTVTALAVNPANGSVTIVGIDAQNHLRFESDLKGRYVKVLAANLVGNALGANDLNPHLPASGAAVNDAERLRSLGDPRAIVWQADGRRAFVAGMGSNSVVLLDASGARDASVAPIGVGEGPAGLAIDESQQRLYVWNHFEASLSTIALDTLAELERRPLFTPLPATVKQGRPFLYNTTLTSGTGHVACASCHVDARIDRLAWDLGNPADEVNTFAGNCIPSALGEPCRNFHPMKGPMVTQTLQDIIGKEPFHWRGDREGIEAFNPTYINLQARGETIDDAQMQRLEDFLASVTYPPNPYRNEDNTLPTSVDLAAAGMASPGRFDVIASPLPRGNAQRGLDLFLHGNRVQIQGIPVVDSCGACHSLPTGFGVNGEHFGNGGVSIGGRTLQAGPSGANKLTIIAHAQVTFATMKIPSLRNLYERTGFDMSRPGGTGGFGLLHDGTIDSLSRYMAIGEFLPFNNRDIADLSAFMLAFSGSDLPTQPNTFTVPVPASKDAHAAVGQTALASSADFARAARLETLARSPRLELVAFTPGDERRVGWLYDRTASSFSSDDGRDGVNLTTLLTSLPAGQHAKLTLVASGTGRGVALDRDGDNLLDGIEVDRGALPFDPTSTAIRPAQGLWNNPARPGHGFDLQFAGDTLIAAWYTYEENGDPTWYVAVGSYAAGRMTAPLKRITRITGQAVMEEIAGQITFEFDGFERGRMNWRLGTREGNEPLQRVRFGPRTREDLHTGVWFDPSDSGWGLSLESQGALTAIVVYFYDAAGQPRWVLGTAPQSSGDAGLGSSRGFAPWQPAVAITTVPGGTAKVTRRFERRIDLVLDARVRGQANDPWVRNTSVIPLTTLPQSPYAQ